MTAQLGVSTETGVEPQRCKVMGIVNITDDSFSDGGQFSTFDAALEHAHELIAQGADIIDLGAESTRPGAQRVPEELELRRIIPLTKKLAADGHLISIDTMRASVAEAAIEAGATLINDVSGGLADPRMLKVCAETDVPVCLMHWDAERFGSASGRAQTQGDIVEHVRTCLLDRVDDAVSAGVLEENIILDPGLGFAKNADDNWALLHGLTKLIDLGFPVLVGASRKRFLATLGGGEARRPQEADPATAAISALSAAAGAWAVRVHNVPLSIDAVRVAAAWQSGYALEGTTADGDYPTGGGNQAVQSAQS